MAGPEVVQETLTHFRQRDDYIEDRAYRLLAAAAAGTSVAPSSPQRAELFRQEESIGRMPMEQAFERLAEIEPGLLNLKSQVEAFKKSGDPGSCGLRQLAGDKSIGTSEVAYFDSPIKHFTASGVLFDFRRSKRPQA